MHNARVCLVAPPPTCVPPGIGCGLGDSLGQVCSGWREDPPQDDDVIWRECCTSANAVLHPGEYGQVTDLKVGQWAPMSLGWLLVLAPPLGAIVLAPVLCTDIDAWLQGLPRVCDAEIRKYAAVAVAG